MGKITQDPGVHVCHNLTPGSREWTDFRTSKIPSMMAAACLNMDPWRSPRRAWREIMGQQPSITDWFAENGRRNQGDAIMEYQNLTSTVTCDSGIWQRSDWPICVATPTQEVFPNGIMLLYMGKTVYKKLPLYRRIRALTQLLVTGKDWVDVVSWRGGITSIDRVFPSGQDGLRLRLSIFHKKFIATGKIPEKGQIPRWVSKNQ